VYDASYTTPTHHAHTPRPHTTPTHHARVPRPARTTHHARVPRTTLMHHTPRSRTTHHARVPRPCTTPVHHAPRPCTTPVYHAHAPRSCTTLVYHAHAPRSRNTHHAHARKLASGRGSMGGQDWTWFNGWSGFNVLLLAQYEAQARVANKLFIFQYVHACWEAALYIRSWTLPSTA